MIDWNDLSLFAGTARLETADGSLLPHRLPAAVYEAFRGNAVLAARARCGAGVRLRFATDARRLDVTLRFPETSATGCYALSLFVDGAFHSSFGPPEPAEAWRHRLFDLPDARWREIELWWPSYAECRLREIAGDPRASFRPSPPEAGPLLLCLGDSITQGASCPHPHRTYAALVAARLGFRLHNLGIGSAVMDPALADLRGEIPFDAATIAIGTNDFGQQRPLGDFRAATRELLGRLRAERPGAPLALLTPLPRWGMMPEGARDGLEAYRAVLREEASRHPSLLLVEGPDLLPDADQPSRTPDGVHPVDLGHQLLGKRLGEFLKPTFSSGRIPPDGPIPPK